MTEPTEIELLKSIASSAKVIMVFVIIFGVLEFLSAFL